MSEDQPAPYVPVHPQSDDYDTSVPEFDVIAPGALVVAGSARRTGITAWGPSRPVYQLHVGPFRSDGREPISGFYVLDGGRFYVSHWWHMYGPGAQP